MKKRNTHTDEASAPAEKSARLGFSASPQVHPYTNLEFNALPGWARDTILALESLAGGRTIPPCKVCGGILSHKDGCKYTGRRVEVQS